MFWKNTIILINGSAIEGNTNAVQKFVFEKEAFFRDNMWKSICERICAHCGTQRSLLSSYLQ